MKRARQPNVVETVPLKLSTTPQVIGRLETLAITGLYGKNGTEVAEQLLRQKLLEIEIPAWAKPVSRSRKPVR